MSDDGFESFWNAYPRHDAKERAIKAWAEIAPSFEVQQAIHAALKWQVLEWQRHDPKFTPMAIGVNFGSWRCHSRTCHFSAA